MSFYITLPSNASMELFPDNLIGNYSTKLCNTIELEGEWEVGLAEIMYPVTWLNTKPLSMKIITKDETFTVTLTILPYETRNDIANKMNMFFIKKRLNLVAHNDIERNQFMFTFHENNIKKMELDPVLAKILGFSFETFIYLESASSVVSDIEQEEHLLDGFLIYSNIIIHQHIGDAYAKVLRIIALDNEQGKRINYVTKVFDIPHYVSLDTNTLDIININLRDLQGNLILFESGKVVVKLHFKRKYF
jgi:hypothetical protein